jgi:hypothetical protein
MTYAGILWLLKPEANYLIKHGFKIHMIQFQMT